MTILIGLLQLYLLLCVLALVISIVKHLVKGILIGAIMLTLGCAGIMGLMSVIGTL